MTVLQNVGIRARIAGGSLLIAILIAVAAAVVFNAQLERIVRDGTEAVLTSDSAPYVVALETEPGESFDVPGPSQLVAVVAPDGTTPVDTLPSALAASVPALVATAGSTEAEAGDTSFVVLTTKVSVAGEDWTVVAARDGVEERTVLGQLRALVFIGLGVMALGTAATAWALTSVSLGPVRRMRRTAAALSEEESTELLDVGEANDEISDLARTLNDLIERLRSSALRERQLVSDASHELRTPIALLNTQLQVAIREASSVDQLVRDLRGAQRNVARLSGLVTSLLELSSIEAVGHVERATLLELDREALEAVDRARFRADDTRVELRYEGLEGDGGATTRPVDAQSPTAQIRAEDFGRVIDNLVDNALRALGQDGSIDVRLEHAGGSVRLTVVDTGGGLDPAFEAHALDRFTRQDTSRRGGQGAGLGLAIVAAVVKRAGGVVELQNRPGVGLTVRVVLPTV
ncbi:HAMP domain-containing histidine kinase [Plantibacter flavus]|uniref:sensor histidine kinase n=1 Tax=Plantibacter flavus TaxID=150123 RepID=UPI003F155EC4